MLAHLALIGILQSAPQPGASPEAVITPQPAATAASANAEDPKVTKIAREQYDAFAKGNLDKSDYSVPIPAGAIAQVQAGLDALGPVKSVKFLGSMAMNGSMMYQYEFTCAKGAAIETLSLKDGKIDGIYFKPAQ